MVTLDGLDVYVDTNTLIYAIEAPSLYPGLQNGFLGPLSRGTFRVTTSWITLAEVLVKPLHLGDAILESAYRAFLTPSPVVRLIPVDADVAAEAARIRAQYGLRLPDALHLATGLRAGCTHFMTRDAQWAKVGVPVIDPASL
jgi:predicted nucleic acid-binding protein